MTLSSGDFVSVYSGTADGFGAPTGVTLLSPTTTLSTIPVSFTSCAADGSITIKFTSPSGNIPSAGFVMTVDCIDAPASVSVINTHPSSTAQNYCVGSSATPLSVSVFATALSPSYQWYSNTSNSNSGGTTLSGATLASYTPPTASTNVGTAYYYCVVANGCDTETSTVSGGITVAAAPAEVVVSSSGTYCVSTTLTASNGSSGTIYWQNASSGGVSTATPSTSQLVTSSGTYFFRAYNGTCWGTEGSATVTINPVASNPTAIAGSGATTNSFSANWNAVVGATGYYLDVSTSATFGTFVTGYSNLTVVNVTTYSVTGLSVGVTYYYRVRAINGCGTSSSSNTITYATLATSYCSSTSTSSTAYFSSFSTSGGITNISNLSSGYSVSGYGNFTGSQVVTQVQSGSVSFTTNITGISGGVGVAIFVDWNQNGVFTDTGENVFNTNGIYVFSNPSGSFSVPSTALSGTTRMRIVCNYFSSTPLSCNSGITGETEDYGFVVTSFPCSANPSLVSIIILSLTSSSASWTAPSPAPANGYQYYLSTSNSTPSASTIPTGSTAAGVTIVTFTGLTASTNYYLWVRSNCGGGLGEGAWVGATSFYQPNCVVGNSTGTTSLGCPDVVSGGLGLSGADPAPIANCTAGSCVSLEATYLSLGQTTNYTVQSIPYAPPYQYKCLQNPVNVSVDDIWSQTINLPFNFCFYGTNYNKCLISSNGVLTFDTTTYSPGGYSTWSFANNLPNNTLFLNSIFGVYHDIDPSEGGQIGWELITLNTGCRALVASWADIPMFSSTCNSQLYTGMIVLYENTNVIEVYIKEKNVCSTWNDGNAIVGLQNATAVQAVVAPNRNGLDPNWSVSSGASEAWRFVPSGPSITSIKWYQGTGTTGSLVGTTDVISVCPAYTTTYTAEVTYALCSGGTLKKTDVINVVVSGSKTWNGSVDSDWNIPANWTPSVLPTLSDCVTVPITPNNPIVVGSSYCAYGGTLSVLNGATLTVNSGNNITITDWVKVEPTANFIIANNANLVQVTNVATNLNIGTITYKRNASLRSDDYVYWSSPVAGFNVSSISSPVAPGPIYKWNTTNANTNGGYGNWQTASGAVMERAIGYIVRGPSSFSATSNSTLFGSFSGVPNNGLITVPINRGPDQVTTYHTGTNGTQITNISDNWNLLGNPYPSSISGARFLFNNRTKLMGQIRLWTHGTLPQVIASPFYDTFVYNYNPGDYFTYDYTGTSCCPTAAADLFVGAAQGFFVARIDGPAGADTVTFNNSLRSDSYTNSLFYRQTNPSTVDYNVNTLERNRIWLDLLDSSNQSTRTLVGYIEGATMGNDSFFDAETLVTGFMSIYSVQGDSKFLIQGRSIPFTPNDIVPIGVTIATTGKHTIAIGAVDGLFDNPNKKIYLEDLYKGVVHDLRQAPYIFDAVQGNYTNRFQLRYKYPPGNQYKLVGNTVVVLNSNNIIEVQSSEKKIRQILVYDIVGREVYNSSVIGSQNYIITTISAGQQALIVKVVLEDSSVQVRKIFFN